MKHTSQLVWSLDPVLGFLARIGGKPRNKGQNIDDVVLRVVALLGAVF